MGTNAPSTTTGSKSVKDLARRALIDRLRSLLTPERAALIDDSGRTDLFADNLLPSLSPEQIAELKEHLTTGDGRELDFGEAGQRPDGHAAHSSATLAFNAFGPWLGRERQLVIDGVGGFSERLRVEAKQGIFRGGRPPNLDCLAVGADVVVGVESKLTEPLARHSRRKWSDAYGRDSCRELLTAGWLEALDAARTGQYTPVYLDVSQLLKHALGLSKQNPGRERHLVYVYWEPVDGDDITEVRRHRDEIDDLRRRVGDASPRLHALPYARLWDEWEALSDLPWLGEHVLYLCHRYEVALANSA
jgi:hypothetical protein